MPQYSRGTNILKYLERGKRRSIRLRRGAFREFWSGLGIPIQVNAISRIAGQGYTVDPDPRRRSERAGKPEMSGRSEGNIGGRPLSASVSPP